MSFRLSQTMEEVTGGEGDHDGTQKKGEALPLGKKKNPPPPAHFQKPGAGKTSERRLTTGTVGMRALGGEKKKKHRGMLA